MGSQDILKFYGSNLDIRVDYSEIYDYALTNNNDFDTISDDLNEFLIINDMSSTIYRLEYGSPYIKKRTEEGWTADFVFNRESLPWISGSTFYYWGISGETIDYNYADNNLSFQFSENGEIIWKSIHYEPKSTLTGYTNQYNVVTGSTPQLCDMGTSLDFNVTITFKRYKTLKDCDLENQGGLNDMISGLTQDISSGSLNYSNWITGDTLNYFAIEKLNKKWFNERKSRLGTLKIYLNGNPIYKLENFEEIIPSERESQNILVQSWGIGTNGIQEIHTGQTQFNLKKIEYFEKPLDALTIKNRYITKIKPNFDITECDSDNNCVGESNQNVDLLITQDGEFIQYF